MFASLWVLAATFLTVLTYVFVKLAPPEASPVDIFFVRSIFLFACMAALAFSRRVSPIPAKLGLLKLHTLRCSAGITALFINILAAQHLPIATAQTLAYSSSLFIGAFVVVRKLLTSAGTPGAAALGSPAASPLHEPCPWALPTTLILGFVGVVLTLRPSFDAALGFYGALALGSAVCTAIASLTLKRIGLHGEPIPRTAFWFAAYSLIVSGLLWWTTSEHELGDVIVMPELLAVGLCTVGSQLAQTKAWGHGQPLLCANLAFSAIIFSVIFGMAVFGETYDLWTSLGIALILATEVAATWMQMRKGK